MKDTIYSRCPGLIIGFHGCDKSVVDKVLSGDDILTTSTNDYDWLGHGIYFWENNATRALQYAEEMTKRKYSSVKNPSVIGTIIDLGRCMDLMDSMYLQDLKEAYRLLEDVMSENGQSLPQNTNIKGFFLPREIDYEFPNPQQRTK